MWKVGAISPFSWKIARKYPTALIAVYRRYRKYRPRARLISIKMRETMQPIHLDRFIRTRRLLGEERFTLLQSRTVTIVGLGAVGGYAVEGLVRAGISQLRIVDYDTVQASNLNRQILALESTLGRPKAEVAKERILAINSGCRVEALQLFAGEETLKQILEPRPDLLIDAIDSLNPKTQLLHGAYTSKIPIISSMGAALRTDPALIRSGDLFSTSNCPLARHLRKRLRRRGVGEGISCVYSVEKIDFEYQLPEEEDEIDTSPYADRGRKRNVLGSLPTITGIFGLTIANQAIMQLSQP
jgi:tRNA A37 threonylcarbamoyladenosine dehydratase